MLRPTFMGFETAKRALSASQRGLDTVGHNISNVNTPGYTRQRVDQVSISSGGYKAKYQAYRSQFPGQGSDVVGISQIRDPFLDNRYRTEAASCGEYSAISNGLSDLNALFDEIQTTGSHAKMSEFLTALDSLIANPESKELATVLRSTAEQVTQILNKNSIELNNVEKTQRDELQNSINEVNSILEQIAMLNVKIKEDNFYGNPSNELNDDRNLLIDQLSEYMDIQVTRTPIKVAGDQYIEQLSITIKNSGDAKNGIEPITLVDSGTFNGLKMKIDETSGEASVAFIDPLSGLEIKLPQADGTKSSDITDKFLTGAIKGHLDILNGKGVFAGAGESGFRGIPYYRQALDDYAAKFAETMNEMNKLAVYVPGGDPVYIERPLFVSNDENNANITAGNISLSTEWRNDPMYLENAVENNALYSDGQYLYYPGDPPTKTGTPGIDINDVKGIDKNGYLVDINGDRFLPDGTTVAGDSDDAVKLDDLQRALTKDTVYYPFDINNYMNSSGNLMVKVGSTNAELSGAYSPDGPYTAADIYVDDNGKLWHASDHTKAINYYSSATATPVQVTKDMLYKTQPGAQQNYSAGDPAPNELLPGASASDNLLVLKNKLTGSIQFDNGFKGSFQQYLVGFQSDMALDQKQNDALLDASMTVLNTIADSRDSVSAVSVDEEGINMMTYQNYYNAAARYMTVLDEALGQIIQNMGVVGR